MQTLGTQFCRKAVWMVPGGGGATSLVPPPRWTLRPSSWSSCTVLLRQAQQQQRRGMAGGKRDTLHKRTIHKCEKHRLILRYCNQLFGIAEITQPKVGRRPAFRPALWVRLETLLFHEVFRNWTKIKHFVDAFEKSKGLYVMETKENILRHKALRADAKKNPQNSTVATHKTNRATEQHRQHTSVNDFDTPERDALPVKPTPMDVIKEKGRMCSSKIRRRTRALLDDEILFVRIDPRKLDPEKHIIPKQYRRIVEEMEPQRKAEAAAAKAAYDAYVRAMNAARSSRRRKRLRIEQKQKKQGNVNSPHDKHSMNSSSLHQRRFRSKKGSVV